MFPETVLFNQGVGGRNVRCRCPSRQRRRSRLWVAEASADLSQYRELEAFATRLWWTPHPEGGAVERSARLSEAAQQPQYSHALKGSGFDLPGHRRSLDSVAVEDVRRVPTEFWTTCRPRRRRRF